MLLRTLLVEVPQYLHVICIIRLTTKERPAGISSPVNYSSTAPPFNCKFHLIFFYSLLLKPRAPSSPHVSRLSHRPSPSRGAAAHERVICRRMLRNHLPGPYMRHRKSDVHPCMCSVLAPPERLNPGIIQPQQHEGLKSLRLP